MKAREEIKRDLLKGSSVDDLMEFCKSRKYALMKRPFDPFPQPIRLGRSSRWVASEVHAWLDRQINRQARSEVSIDELTLEVPTKQASSTTSKVDGIMKMKSLYESGYTLDELCRQFNISKVRLSQALRDVGTAMRRPGPNAIAKVSEIEDEDYWWHRMPEYTSMYKSIGTPAQVKKYTW